MGDRLTMPRWKLSKRLSFKNRWFWFCALLGLVLDQLSKLWAVRVLQPLGDLPLWPQVFHLTFVTNPGAAWNLFADMGDFLRWVSLAVCLVLLGIAIWGKPWSRWEQWGYGCILAGAAGNGWDRFTLGYVIDFLHAVAVQFPTWDGGRWGWATFPVFNLADILINAGVICLLVAAWREGRDPEAQSVAKNLQK
ncbi:MAG: signal peptidase II [Synechococcales cyanobacterium]